MSKIKTMNYTKLDYPDGSFYPNVIEFSDKLTFTINSYNDLWFLKQLKDVCDHNNKKVHLTVPCLIDAQADRRFYYNQSHNLKLVCDFINEMNWESVSVFHPHNPEVVEALIKNVQILDNSNFIINVLSRLDYQNLVLMSTDAGGYKPLMKLCDKINWQGDVISATKSRTFENGKSKLVQIVNETNFGGKDVLIIDDLMIYGGTMIGLANILKERNVGNIYMAISHTTVKNPKADIESLYKKVFTTNSKFNEYGLNNIEVIKMF